MKKRRILWIAAAVMLLLFLSVTAYADGTISPKEELDNSEATPLPMIIGLPENISRLFDFGGRENDLKEVTLPPDAELLLGIKTVPIPAENRTEFYLYCKSSFGSAAIDLTFRFTDETVAQGEIYLSSNGQSPFRGTYWSGYTETADTALSSSDGLEIKVIPQKNYDDTADLHLFFYYSVMKSWVQQYFGDNDVDLVLRPVPPASAEPLKSELSAKGNNDQEFYLCSFRSLEGSNIYPLREILQRPYEIWLERNDQRIPTGFTIRGAFLFHFDAFPETLYAGFKYNTFQIIGKGINLNCNWTAGTSSELIGSTDGKVIPLKPEVFEEPRSLRGTITLQTGGSSGGSVNLSAKITKILSPIEPHYSDEVELTTAETMLFGIVNEPKGVRAYDFPIVIKVEDSAGNDVTHAFTIRCDDSTGI